jgi:predicted DNA-binding transcriptional regulator YafY
MKKEYLTIREVADKAGVSYQAIYKRLNSTLKDYVVEVEGRKALKPEVLRVMGSTPRSTVKPSETSTVKEGLNSSSSEEKEMKRINKRNEEIIDDLRAQLKDKDEQIKKQSEHIVELSGKIAELFENNQKLQLNYQMLLSDGETNRDIVDVDVEGARAYEEVKEDDNDTVPESGQDARDNNEEPQKKSFFQKLFG